MAKKNTVIYIISDRRSGSTLLENILSRSSEVFSVGELAMLHGHILKKGPGERWNWTCSCGEPVLQCIFWGPVLQKTWQKNQQDFNSNISWNYKSKKLLSVAVLPFLFRNKLLDITGSARNKNVQPTLDSLYKAIFEEAGKTFVVDSSKDPLQALSIYRGNRDYDVKIIWLTRDMRATAVSKSKWKELNVKKQKSIGKILTDVFYYRRLSLGVTGFVKKEDLLKMNYEDIALHTQEQLNRLTNAFGLDDYKAPEYMFVENDHTIGGTPNRFSKRPIAYDDAWKKAFEHKKFLYWVGGLLNKL